MNHRRKGPKSTRSGCMMCKHHKRQGAKLNERLRPNQMRKLQDAE